MKALSLKVKILFSIVTLTIFSLGVFSYLTFNSYMKDKLAFVYDYLASETQSKAMLFTSTIEHQDFFLNSIISSLDPNTRQLPSGTQKFLKGSTHVMGIFLYLPQRAELSSLYESSAWNLESVTSDNLKNGPMGLSLLDSKTGHFLMKKPLSIAGGFAAMVFRNSEMLNVLRSGPGRFSLLLKGEQVFSQETSKLDTNSVLELMQKLGEFKTSSGLFETNVGNDKYFASYSKIPYQGLVLVNLIAESKVLMIQTVFLKQVMVFLLLLGSVSLLIGTLSARWLTLRLDDLTHAAQELENENFEHVVEVDSEDELGTVGSAFNSMGEKIRSLLEELRRYNSQLEQMVEERTRELQRLSDIQNAMLNSLGQGFVIVDKEHKILPVYSKAAVDMFEKVPDEGEPEEIMGVKPEEVDNFREFYDLVFNQVLEFDDMVKMNPDFRSNSKGQKIQLNYAPIKNSESNELEYVMIIGSDKTQEIENMEKFNKEWNFSQMMMKISSNRFSLNKVLKESLSMLRTSLEAVEANRPGLIKEVQRYVHTIKGSFSYFSITDITQMANDFESYLEPHLNKVECPQEMKVIILEKIMALQVAIECYIDKFDQIIQYKTAQNNKTIPIENIQKFSQLLSSKAPDLLAAFTDTFNRVEVQPFFQMYPSIVQDLSIKLNKNVRFTLEGASLSLPEGQWEELFSQFIHFVRNSVDHGIETEQDRQAAGKDPQGEIRFSFKLHPDSLEVSLRDDGRGVDWQKIAQKDPTIKSEQDAIKRIMEGGISSKDEVSEVSGRGVGVSAITAMVQKWEGSIKVFNKPMKGFCITIQVPLKKANKLKVAS